MCRIENKQCAAIVQHNSRVTRNHAGTKTFKQAIDEGNCVAVFINHREVDRVPTLGETGPRGRHRAIGRYELSPLSRVFLRYEAVDRHAHFIGICNVGVAVGESHFLRLDHEVKVLGRIMAQTRQVIAFKDVQHLEHSDSLRLSTEFVDIVPSVSCPDGIHPLRVELREVGKSQRSIVLFRKIRDLFRNVTFVENVAAAFGNLPERGCEFGYLENIAVPRRAAVDQEITSGIGRCTKSLFSPLPLTCDNLGNGKSFVGVFDRGRQHADHRELSVSLMELVPTGYSAGNGNRLHTGDRNRRQLTLREKIGGRFGSCPAAGI